MRWEAAATIPREGDEPRAREAGFDTHLVKPAGIEAIDRLLHRSRDAVR